MRPDPFPGKIGKTVAQSTRWWPAQPGAASSQPNVLVVLFDGVGFADPGCLGSTSRTPTIDALAARGFAVDGPAQHGHVPYHPGCTGWW